MTVVWYAPHATIKVGATLGTVSTTSSLETQVTGTDFTAEIKELTISGGARDVEKIDLLGPNQEIQQNRPELFECSFTLIGLQDKDFSEIVNGPATTIGTTGFSRVQGGEKTTAAADRVKKAVLFHLEDPTGASPTIEVNIVLNNAFGISQEHGLAADGSEESTVTFKCLAKDYYEEFKGP